MAGDLLVALRRVDPVVAKFPLRRICLERAVAALCRKKRFIRRYRSGVDRQSEQSQCAEPPLQHGRPSEQKSHPITPAAHGQVFGKGQLSLFSSSPASAFFHLASRFSASSGVSASMQAPRSSAKTSSCAPDSEGPFSRPKKASCSAGGALARWETRGRPASSSSPDSRLARISLARATTSGVSPARLATPLP